MDLDKPFAVITPTLDGPTLCVLVRSDYAMTAGEVHRSLADYSIAGVRRTLSRLADEHIVLVTGTPERRLYSLNRDHIAAPYVRRIAGLREDLHARVRAHVSKWSPRPIVAATTLSPGSECAGRRGKFPLLVVGSDEMTTDRWAMHGNELGDQLALWCGLQLHLTMLRQDDIQDPQIHAQLRRKYGDPVVLFHDTTRPRAVLIAESLLRVRQYHSDPVRIR